MQGPGCWWQSCEPVEIWIRNEWPQGTSTCKNKIQPGIRSSSSIYLNSGCCDCCCVTLDLSTLSQIAICNPEIGDIYICSFAIWSCLRKEKWKWRKKIYRPLTTDEKSWFWNLMCRMPGGSPCEGKAHDPDIFLWLELPPAGKISGRAACLEPNCEKQSPIYCGILCLSLWTNGYVQMFWFETSHGSCLFCFQNGSPHEGLKFQECSVANHQHQVGVLHSDFLTQVEAQNVSEFILSGFTRVFPSQIFFFFFFFCLFVELLQKQNMLSCLKCSWNIFRWRK